MISTKNIENRAFFSEFERSISEKGHIYYKITSKIFEKLNLSQEIKSISPLNSSGNYDTYELSCDEVDFILKISLDPKDIYLTNESLFYKNNNDQTLCNYIDSGVIKVGDEIRFLLLENNLGLNINELGRSYVLKNIDSLFFALINQRKLVAVDTIKQYIEKLDKEVSLEDLSEFSLSDIKHYQDVSLLSGLIKDFKSSIKVLSDNDFIKKSEFCHGNLGMESVTSLGGLYKFCDFDNCFLGNQFLDISLLVLNINGQERDFNSFCKKYCDLLGLDFELKKEEARHCLKLACSIFLLRLVYEFIIEQCIYKNSREDKIINIVKKLEESQWAIKKLDLKEETTLYIKKIFKEPVDFDKELREKYQEDN